MTLCADKLRDSPSRYVPSWGVTDLRKPGMNGLERVRRLSVTGGRRAVIAQSPEPFGHDLFGDDA